MALLVNHSQPLKRGTIVGAAVLLHPTVILFMLNIANIAFRFSITFESPERLIEENKNMHWIWQAD